VKLGTYVIAPEPISTVYFIIPPIRRRSTTEHSSTCHCISSYTVCWMYWYRLQIKWDYKKKYVCLTMYKYSPLVGRSLIKTQLLDSGVVKMLPWQWIQHTQQQMNCWMWNLPCSLCCIKESRWSVLPRTSCCISVLAFLQVLSTITWKSVLL
jgi:hypothetical protein